MDMVCLRNISVDTLHKGDTGDDDDDDDDIIIIIMIIIIIIINLRTLVLRRPCCAFSSSSPLHTQYNSPSNGMYKISKNL